jgi:hypothetical protein
MAQLLSGTFSTHLNGNTLEVETAHLGSPKQGENSIVCFKQLAACENTVFGATLLPNMDPGLEGCVKGNSKTKATITAFSTGTMALLKASVNAKNAKGYGRRKEYTGLIIPAAPLAEIFNLIVETTKQGLAERFVEFVNRSVITPVKSSSDFSKEFAQALKEVAGSYEELVFKRTAGAVLNQVDSKAVYKFIENTLKGSHNYYLKVARNLVGGKYRLDYEKASEPIKGIKVPASWKCRFTGLELNSAEYEYVELLSAKLKYVNNPDANSPFALTRLMAGKEARRLLGSLIKNGHISAFLVKAPSNGCAKVIVGDDNQTLGIVAGALTHEFARLGIKVVFATGLDARPSTLLKLAKQCGAIPAGKFSMPNPDLVRKNPALYLSSNPPSPLFVSANSKLHDLAEVND